MPAFTSAPFPPSCALNKELLGSPSSAKHDSSQPQSDAETIQYIPGNPTVSLFPNEVYDHLSKELATPLLDKLYIQLWLVAKKSGYHIDALHAQKVKGRSIIPTEDPRLHLVWNRNKIYIKPVPLCLQNHEFWVRYLQPPKRALSSIAIGFMRSYAYLIKSPLDFAIAKESYLIPTDIDWIQWSIFINHFHLVKDESVARRYHYGQLRLSRLNWAVRIFRPKYAGARWCYENPYWSTGEFIERATFPLVFLFASVSIALSSMQVALSVPVEGLWSHEDGQQLQEMNRAFWLFSIAVVLLWLLTWVLLLGIPLVVLCAQVLWGFRNREEKQGINSSTV
ncbi:Pc12g03920 [Penicillium rubens Wisconsin 54-1255]|uniref:Pc12g03920 protein n=1 Tax=Penicillium rubens (strain ATCC 28089 / DSM 1075 / NRRL 1951 / Wisconsin 54-1255) TaxID=500485 RepID=B6GXA5_PENRW|nr:Pc12g03920 [Penicillium rubens Wisconsin 54-1255]